MRAPRHSSATATSLPRLPQAFRTSRTEPAQPPGTPAGPSPARREPASGAALHRVGSPKHLAQVHPDHAPSRSGGTGPVCQSSPIQDAFASHRVTVRTTAPPPPAPRRTDGRTRRADMPLRARPPPPERPGYHRPRPPPYGTHCRATSGANAVRGGTFPGIGPGRWGPRRARRRPVVRRRARQAVAHPRRRPDASHPYLRPGRSRRPGLRYRTPRPEMSSAPPHAVGACGGAGRPVAASDR
ncbi:hypothetical protein FHU30_007399 [Actinomadura rupiterrae]|nr:hypothetical protein [Actinomadura rupiterrae]